MKRLRDFTMARVQLDRAGAAVATHELLAFQLAHAAARDAVHHPFDTVAFGVECASRGWPFAVVKSAAPDRSAYLRRPDLGRKLGGDAFGSAGAMAAADLALVVADGLSSLAVHRHSIAVLEMLIPLVDAEGWPRSPVIAVEQGRVAIGDEIGERLRASIALVLIGERPGLSSPDSLGAYLTWNPRTGRTDAERNCVSNIRPEGLPPRNAACRVFSLMVEARRRQLTGVALKEGLSILT